MRITTYPVSWALPDVAAPLMFRSVVNLLALRAPQLTHTPVDTTHRDRPVRGEWVDAPPRPGTRIIYYLHGSGYVACSPATHRLLVTRLVRRTGRPAFSLDYPLAPEHRFPAAHNATVNGYLWLLEQGFSAQDIVVSGDSAGGHLALALCGELRRLGLPMPAGLVLMSPLIDASFDTAAGAARRVRDFSAVSRLGKALIGRYTRGAELEDPRLDVVREAGADLPPMLIQAGAREMMSADAERIAAAQEAAGGDYELQIWPGQTHVFQMLPMLPESREALNEIASFVASLDQARSQAG